MKTILLYKDVKEVGYVVSTLYKVSMWKYNAIRCKEMAQCAVVSQISHGTLQSSTVVSQHKSMYATRSLSCTVILLLISKLRHKICYSIAEIIPPKTTYINYRLYKIV